MVILRNFLSILLFQLLGLHNIYYQTLLVLSKSSSEQSIYYSLKKFGNFFFPNVYWRKRLFIQLSLFLKQSS